MISFIHSTDAGIGTTDLWISTPECYLPLSYASREIYFVLCQMVVISFEENVFISLRPMRVRYNLTLRSHALGPIEINTLLRHALCFISGALPCVFFIKKFEAVIILQAYKCENPITQVPPSSVFVLLPSRFHHRSELCTPFLQISAPHRYLPMPFSVYTNRGRCDGVLRRPPGERPGSSGAPAARPCSADRPLSGNNRISAPPEPSLPVASVRRSSDGSQLDSEPRSVSCSSSVTPGCTKYKQFQYDRIQSEA